MNKKILITTFSIILVIIISLGVYAIYKEYRVSHAEKIVVINMNTINVYEEIYLKDLIKKINGKLLENKKINLKFTTYSGGDEK